VSQNVPPNASEHRQRYGVDVFTQQSAAEDERLSLIEDEQDPHTTARIEAFGIATDWHCLEVGAGKGSMARWLADRCPSGRVIATDLDLSRLRHNGRPNLEFHQHDIEVDEFHPGSFHLIHARAVLTHLRDPQAICDRMAGWLRPGGWLLVADPASFSVESSPHELMRKAGAAATAVMQQMLGTRANWARSYPSPLLRAGLVEVGAECVLRTMQGGTREAVMFDLMLAQIAGPIVASGQITAGELAELRAQLHDPGFYDFPPAVIRAWGQRPVTEISDFAARHWNRHRAAG
jgi:2-polyprenyl-3-methyl-5-hydroxy-6-metoxy-1,4-benzoquinol methylase